MGVDPQDLRGNGLLVLVCGSSKFTVTDTVFTALNRIDSRKGISAIMADDLPGASRLGRHWAIANGKPVILFTLNQDDYGHKAGFFRNKSMVEDGKPDVVLAFPGGSRTADIVARARHHDIPVMEIEYTL